ncbi:hypothetical protein tinsulaeT_00510 [Thalassotalea insulae]|uniref:Uncharacterized protein n=2 Tax=Thalassotalea insulae TaxID=2056778 RepID=A0ABQ6GPV1_9GAMM|nr:hypothetical protein tinsulaeT_00510 [Thalassotalea insulae]
MPVWAYIYLLVVVLGSVYSMYSINPKSSYYVVGEILSTFACFGLFFIYFNIINLSQIIVYSTLMFVYMLYWSVWVNRHHYSFFWTPANEFVQTVELGENETLEEAVFSIKIIKLLGLAFIFAMSIPVYYVYFKIVTGN